MSRSDSANDAELREMVEALRRSEEHLRLFVEHTPALIAMLDSDSRYIAWSRRWVEAHGLKQTDLLGRVVGEAFESFPDHWLAVHERCRAGAIEHNDMERFVRSDGVEIFLRWEVQPWYEPDGTVGGTIIFAEDVTARKKAEDALRESEARFRTLVEAKAQAVWEATPDGRALGDSPTWRKYTGQSYEQYQELGSFHVLHPEDSERVKARWLAAVRLESEFDEEFRIRTADGKWCWTNSVGVPIRDAEGAVVRWVGMNIDITARKNAEMALRQSEERFRFLVEAKAQAVWEANPQGEIIDHAAWCAYTGLTADEIRECGGLKAFHADDQEQVRRVWQAAVATEQPIDAEFRVRRKDGKWRWTNVVAAPIHDDAGGVVKWVGMNLDVTERREATEAVREREQQLRTLVRHAPMSISMFDRDMNYLACSKLTIRGSRREDDEPIGRNHYEVFPDIPQSYKQVHARCLAGAVERCEEEVVRHADGSLAYAKWEVRPWHTPHGDIGGIVIYAQDITEAKRAERAIRESEQRLRTFIDSAPVVIAMLDRDFRILAASQECQVFWKSRVQDCVGKSLLEAVGDLSAGWRRPFEAVLADADGTFREVRWERAGGEVMYYRWSAQPWYTATGETGGIIVFAEDITDGKRAEELVINSRRRLSNAMKIARLGYWELDLRTNLFTFDDQFYSLFHTTAAEVGGDTMSPAEYARRFVHPDDATLVREETEKAIATADPNFSRYLEHRIRYADGGVGYLGVRFFIEKDAQGRTIKTYGANQDITERKRDEERRRSLEAEMLHAEKLKSLGILAGGIAHDFNNILAIIMNYSSIAADTPDLTAQARDALKQIDLASDRAAQLCKSMLAYSGRGKFVVEPLDLSALVRETESLLHVSFSKKTRFTMSLADGVPKIEADSSQIRQVIMNLVTNAAEAIGDAVGDVVLETGITHFGAETLQDNLAGGDLPAGEYVYAKVVDSGCGMDLDTRARAFDPFFTTKQTGRGLGMAAVLGIVRAHRGVILCDSSPDQGTTFTVAFAPVTPLAASPTPTVSPSAVDLSTATILVVDDEPSVRTLIANTLRTRGCTVLETQNGLEGLDVYAAHADQIALSIVDMSMPQLNGRECLHAIRAQTPDARVILVSGYTEEHAESALDVPNGFLSKPFRPAALIALVERVIGSTGGTAVQ